MCVCSCIYTNDSLKRYLSSTTHHQHYPELTCSTPHPLHHRCTCFFALLALLRASHTNVSFALFFFPVHMSSKRTLGPAFAMAALTTLFETSGVLALSLAIPAVGGMQLFADSCVHVPQSGLRVTSCDTKGLLNSAASSQRSRDKKHSFVCSCTYCQPPANSRKR